MTQVRNDTCDQDRSLRLQKIDPLRFHIQSNDDIKGENRETSDHPSCGEAREIRIDFWAMQRQFPFNR
jgi:hypothetical protein